MGDAHPELFRRWVHSREEDEAEVHVYRPKGHKLPPARGRRGIEFKQGGDFVEYGIARGDGAEATPGRWSVDDEGRLEVEVEGRESYRFEIVCAEPELLKLRRL